MYLLEINENGIRKGGMPGTRYNVKGMLNQEHCRPPTANNGAIRRERVAGIDRV